MGTVTRREISGLINGTVYTFELRAVNTAGNSPTVSTTATPRGAKQTTAPTNLQVTAASQQLNVTWNWSDDTGGACVEGSGRTEYFQWELAYRKSSGTQWVTSAAQTPNTADAGIFTLQGMSRRNFEINTSSSGILPGETGVALDAVPYDVRLIAYAELCATPPDTPWSEWITVYGIPPVGSPTVENPIDDQTLAVGITTNVELAGVFSDPEGQTLNFGAVSSDIAKASVSLSGTTTLTVTGVAVGEATVTVTATDTGNLSVDDAFTVTVVSGAPTLDAAAGDTKVSLTWTPPANTTGISKYQYRYRKTAEATWTAWEDVNGGASAASQEVTGLDNGDEYTFEVRAVINGQNGLAASAPATPTLPTPAAPGSFAAGAGDTVVELSWTAPTNASSITDFQVRYWKTSETAQDNWATVTGGADATTTTITGLTNGTPYTFQVRARNSAGDGDPATATATPALAVPGAPTLTASAGDATVSLTWIAPANTTEIDSYEVRYQAGSGAFGPWDDVGTATSREVTGLTNGTEYTFEVRARNHHGPRGLRLREGDADLGDAGRAGELQRGGGVRPGRAELDRADEHQLDHRLPGPILEDLRNGRGQLDHGERRRRRHHPDRHRPRERDRIHLRGAGAEHHGPRARRFRESDADEQAAGRGQGDRRPVRHGGRVDRGVARRRVQRSGPSDALALGPVGGHREGHRCDQRDHADDLRSRGGNTDGHGDGHRSGRPVGRRVVHRDGPAGAARQAGTLHRNSG